MSVLQVEMYALAIIGLITTVISAFYYLRIVKIIYFDKSKEPFDEKVSMGLKITLLMTCMIIALYFINPSILIDLVSDINII